MPWQKKARAAIAIFVVVFVVIVVVALRQRKPPPPQTVPARKDPNAVVENTGTGKFEQTKDGRVQFAIKFGSQFAYPDGRTKFGNVEVTFNRNGKPFTVTSREAEIEQA